MFATCILFHYSVCIVHNVQSLSFKMFVMFAAHIQVIMSVYVRYVNYGKILAGRVGFY